MRKSFKDSVKALEADIQHANTVASNYPVEYNGAYYQMRLQYTPAAHLFLFLVQWTGCSLAGYFGMLRILIYKAYIDGKTTMFVHERKASIKDFYEMIFPSLKLLERGISDVEDRKQRGICKLKFKKKDNEDKVNFSAIDLEREEECGICMEINSKVVLPSCTHALCMTCYLDWNRRSRSCPFCRGTLKNVNSADLWVYTDDRDIVDTRTICIENLKRLVIYIKKLPLVAGPVIGTRNSRIRR